MCTEDHQIDILGINWTVIDSSFNGLVKKTFPFANDLVIFDGLLNLQNVLLEAIYPKHFLYLAAEKLQIMSSSSKCWTMRHITKQLYWQVKAFMKKAASVTAMWLNRSAMKRSCSDWFPVQSVFCNAHK